MRGIQGQHLSQEVVGVHQDSSAMLAHMPQHDADFHLEIPIILLGDITKSGCSSHILFVPCWGE
jgi:hypothetical protein